MRAVMPMIGISSVMSRHCVGAVFWLTNSQHALDPAKNAPSHTAHNSTHEAADRSKYLIEKARVTAFRARELRHERPCEQHARAEQQLAAGRFMKPVSLERVAHGALHG